MRPRHRQRIHRHESSGRDRSWSDALSKLHWHQWKAQHAGRSWYIRYLLAIEWGLEWFYYRLRGLALFDLLELAGRCTVLVIAVLWLLEADDRTKESHYRAWELINSARGSTGDGGRKDALQDLNRDGVSLALRPWRRPTCPKWTSRAPISHGRTSGTPTSRFRTSRAPTSWERTLRVPNFWQRTSKAQTSWQRTSKVPTSREQTYKAPSSGG